MRRTLQGVSLAVVAVLLAAGGWVACAAKSVPDDEPRAFEVNGTPVDGTPGIEGAPILHAGTYTDVAPGSDAAKHYTVRRNTPGSTVFVGVSARPLEPSRDDELDVQLWTFSGTPCGQATNRDFDTGRQNSLVNVAVHTIARNRVDREACKNATELHLVVEPAYGASTLPGAPDEIVVIEEPAATSADGLPPPTPVAAGWGSPMPIEERKRVRPGASFGTAPALSPGAFRSSVRPGEAQIFRVRLRWGQRMRTELRINPPGKALAAALDAEQTMDLRLIGPTRAEAGVPYAEIPGTPAAVVRRDRDTRLVHMTYDVRYLNRDVPADGGSARSAGASLAGDYYIVVTLADDARAAAGEATYAVPYTLDIAVDDTTDGGAPAYAPGERIAGPATAPVLANADTGPGLRAMVTGVLLTAGLVLLVFGGLALFVTRRFAPGRGATARPTF